MLAGSRNPLPLDMGSVKQVSIIIYKKEGLCMFDVHLTTIKVIDIENNKVVIDSTFGEKEYVLR